MAWFFENGVSGSFHTITGENARHIIKSLRMVKGEELTLCDENRDEYGCVIESISQDSVEVNIISKKSSENEPSVNVTLFQCMPKSDKMDLIIQKAVELGASRIVPVLSRRCVSRPDKAKADKKLARYNKIALEAAKQSRRAAVPVVSPLMPFADAAKLCSCLESSVVFYEQGGSPAEKIIKSDAREIGIFIGPEGGFDPQEIELLNSLGVMCATLGKRILRAETAPLAALSIIMYITGNFN